jgi:hypothetical protein
VLEAFAPGAAAPASDDEEEFRAMPRCGVGARLGRTLLLLAVLLSPVTTAAKLCINQFPDFGDPPVDGAAVVEVVGEGPLSPDAAEAAAVRRIEELAGMGKRNHCEDI